MRIGKDTFVDRWFLVLLLAFIVTCVLLAIAAKRVEGQEIPQNTSAEIVAKAKTGDILLRQKATEIQKGEKENQLVAKLFSTPQWDMTGKPLVEWDVGKITAKSRYVEFIPDEVTKSLKVERVVSNTGVKETWYVPSPDITKLVWMIDTDATTKWDVKKGILTFTGFDSVYMFETTPFIAKDAKGKQIPLKIFFSDMMLQVDIPKGEWVYPVEVDPSTTVAYVDTDANTGTIEGWSDVSWLTGRNLADGTAVSATAFRVDASNEAGGASIYNRRAPAIYSGTLPAGATVDSATICVQSVSEAGTFSLSCCEATFTGSLAVGWYNDFTGWASSGAYTVTRVSPSIIASTNFANGDTLRFPVVGATYINAIIAGSLSVMFLNSADIDGTPAPATDTSIGTQFDDDNSYIQVYCQVPSSVLPRSITQFGKPTPFRTEAGISVLKQP